MKGLKIYFSFAFVVVVFCFLTLIGCGSVSDSVVEAPVSDVGATFGGDTFNPRDLPEYRELPLPSADEPSAIMGIGETPSRAKSSDDFFIFLKNDLLTITGEVRLDFYGKDPLLDIYGDYLGSRTVKAYDFFAGTAQEKVKAREYWIFAYTYCEKSGYCFRTDAVHASLRSNEFNQILFTFYPTGNVLIPCYIEDPGSYYAIYVGDESIMWWIQGIGEADAYLPQSPSYEEGKLIFNICCRYTDLNNEKEMDMELHIQSKTDLHILKFPLNLLDITTCQRPLQLVATEVPSCTIGYSGEFDFEKKEIIIDDPVDGDVIVFPLKIRGNVKGINQIRVQIINGTLPIYDADVAVNSTMFEYDIVLDADYIADYIKTGDRLHIILSDWADDLVKIDVIVADAVVLPVVRLSADTPSGIVPVGENRVVAIVEVANPYEQDLRIKSLTPSFAGQWLAGGQYRLRAYYEGTLLYDGEWDPAVDIQIADVEFADVVVPPNGDLNNSSF